MAVYYRASPANEWLLVDKLCLGGPGGRLLTPADLAGEVGTTFAEAIPSFVVKSQPVGGRTLVNLDTIFYADYAGAGKARPALDKTVDVLGFDVRLVATPSWTWTFEPGATSTFKTPGEPYPAKTIIHRYTTLGERTVSVQASWKGIFFVDGDGPFDIAEPVTQARTAALQVVATRSELIAQPSG